jgi:alpha-tubulin suppressor-like RCC1 family protein
VGGTAITDASNTTYTLSGIDANAYIYVKLYYTDNYGTPEIVYSSPTVQIVGLPPSDVSATATSATTASISFTPSENVTSYTVTTSPGGITSSGTSSPIVVSGLTANTAYTFTMTSAYGSYSTPSSEASNSINTYISAPTNVLATATSTTTATVTFTAPAGGSANAITYTLSGGGSYDLSGTTFTVTGLTANTAYTFTVNATASSNNTSASASAIQTYIDAPTNVIATATSSASATVTFTEPTGGSANTITYTLSGGGSYNLSGTTFSVTGLTTNTAYTFTVNATASLNSASASASEITTDATTDGFIVSAPSSSHSIGLKSDKTIYGTGSNLSFQLAIMDDIVSMINTTGKTPVSVSSGNIHTMVLMDDGSIYGCGSNGGGRLGDGTTTNRSTLTLMTNTTGKTPQSIYCGGSHTMVLMGDGSIYGCGFNSNGQLGDGTTTNRSTLTLMTNSTGKTPVSISCGGSHTIVLMSDGTIYGCGNNFNGQLGDGTTTQQTTLTLMTNSTGKTPQSISCGNSHTMILMSDGSIYGCGSNNNGQLGDGTTANNVTALSLMTNTTEKTPQSISCGNGQTMVLMSDGLVYGCGLNSSGQLGDGTTTNRSTLTLMTNGTGKTPQSISCGNGHTIVLMSDGTIYGCGLNSSNQLGDGTTTSKTTLTLMTNSTGKTPQSIHCGQTHTILLMSDGSIYGNGSNSNGQFGDGTSGGKTTFNLFNNPTGKTPVSISCGNSHTMVLMGDGSIYGSGNNEYSQLGDETTTNRSTLTLMTNSTGKTPVSISCGENYTMVLMSDGLVYGCGSNTFGRLGDGTSTNRSTLTLMTNTTGKTPISISCGTYHTMVLMSDGSIYGCGSNGSGQLGDGTTTQRLTLTLTTNSIGTPLSISCGQTHTIVLMSDGTIYGCGSNFNGQLGDGTTTQRTTLTSITNSTGQIPVSISCGNGHTMVLMSDGTIYGCGRNNAGQLGDGTTTQRTTLTLMTNSTGKTPVSIYCGSNHTMVLMSDGYVYACGFNSSGELGDGTTTQRTTLTQMTVGDGITPIRL